MKILPIAGVPAAQLDALDLFAHRDAGPELRDILLNLSRCARDGSEVAVIDPAETLTPSQASARLGMSRTHLYKLLDQGAIPSHRVGRDRRISLRDLLTFEEQRGCDRAELAERFAHQEATRKAAIDEVADLL